MRAVADDVSPTKIGIQTSQEVILSIKTEAIGGVIKEEDGGRPAETSRRRETVGCRPLISEDLPSFARRALSENYSSDESRTTQDQGVKDTSVRTKAMLALLLIAQTAMSGCLYMRFVVLA